MNTEKRKPVVGETLYSLNVGNAARRVNQTLTPVTVTKVGRKYFECCHPNWLWTDPLVYHLSDWREKTEYSADSKLYQSPEEYQDEADGQRIHDRLREVFVFTRPFLSTATLKEIEAIIDRK